MTALPPDDAPEPVPAASDHIVGISFAKANRADEALLAVVHLQQEGAVALTDAVVAIKDDAGKVHIRQTADPTPGRAAMGSALWGALLGALIPPPLGLALGAGVIGGAALTAKLVDLGLDDDWVKEVATWLDPGTSALLLLVAEGSTPALVRELERYEGTVIYGAFPGSVREELERTVAEQPPVDAPQV